MTFSLDANENLLKEGIDREKIYFVSADSKDIIVVFNNIDDDKVKKGKPKHWDGRASSRIVKMINSFFDLV